MFDNPTPGQSRPLADRANFLLSQLGFHIAQTFAARLAPLGIAPNHFGLLTHVERNEGSSQQRLADALGIHRKVMVGLLDDLERRGLVERRRHPGDRRAHAIHLTEAAHELLPRARDIADQHEEEVLATLDSGERAQFVAVLQRLAADIGSPPGVHPGLPHAAAWPRPATASIVEG
ncbi:MarR family winged helix-turn-helix transcriptional regulator [Micromonospora endolithica]|uniref:MarR family transcriptional regulator n=1 Tax=Micromonospora endolithica TaxID=230091 RepID=A0A3A9YU95_9ACTN|nr:MarR family winged helix-turn-helix transcriptional regulator [Micromonospora endolithica]RKN39633.1 MarR family transcriptional regulator [Micromonospora endolithica]